jgi:cytochrome c5
MTTFFMRWLVVSLAAVSMGLLSSCQTTPNKAFPTAEALVTTGNAPATELSTLERGRHIFAMRCTECHVARPIAGLSAQQWRHAVASMAPRAGLQRTDRTALETYLLTARQSLP